MVEGELRQGYHGLIHKFLLGLACTKTKKRIWDTIPGTLDEALTRALNVQASIDISSQENKVLQLAQLDLIPAGAPEVQN